MGPGFVFNDIDIIPGGKFRLGSMRRKRNNTAGLGDNTAKLEDKSERFEEITDQEEEPTRFKEHEGRLSIGEQKALAAKRNEYLIRLLIFSRPLNRICVRRKIMIYSFLLAARAFCSPMESLPSSSLNLPM